MPPAHGAGNDVRFDRNNKHMQTHTRSTQTTTDLNAVFHGIDDSDGNDKEQKGNKVFIGSPPPKQPDRQRKHLKDNTRTASSDNNVGSQNGNNELMRLKTWKILFQMARPSNMPSVILLHLFGTYKMTSCLGIGGSTSLSSSSSSSFRDSLRVALHPSMMLTLFVLLLLSSTSMIVNDYYDAKLGTDYFVDKTDNDDVNNDNDNDNDNALEMAGKKSHDIDSKSFPALVSGQITPPVVKEALNYLYAILLLSMTAVPGIATRLMVIKGAMLTFYYTKFLKPCTGWKNVVCSFVMAISPLASGLAVLSIFGPPNGTVQGATATGSLLLTEIHSSQLYLPLLSRVGKDFGLFILSLFLALVGREMTMDVVDYDSDGRAGIETVPVKYGKAVATRCVCALWTAVSLLTFINACSILSKLPLVPLRSSPMRILRLAFATVNGAWFLVRGFQLMFSKGDNSNLSSTCIEEGKLSLLFMLGASL
jgi:4-hydroxybenzoate polyprenyltransferase